jgi:hypothetical protein
MLDLSWDIELLPRCDHVWIGTNQGYISKALRRGYREIRAYTHQTMVENQRLYASIGYEETGRGTEAGYRPHPHA